MNAFLSAYALNLSGVLGVLFINAMLVAAEMALVRLRFSHFNPDLLDYLERQSRLQKLMSDPDAVVQGVRMMVALCLVGYSYLFVRPARDLLGHFETGLWGQATVLAVIVAIVLAACVHYLIADLIPRALGANHALPVLRLFYWPMMALVTLVRPLMWPMGGLAGFILKPFKVRETRPLAPLEIEAQLELMGQSADSVPLAVQKILRNTLHLRELVVSDVLLPRNQVKIFDLSLSNRENLELARETGHTRFPLCEGDLDRCIGLVHIKDIFRYRGALDRIDLRRLRREMIRLGAEEPLEQALGKLLAHKMHMALVIDEFRGVQGVLTLERILEQVVGDIRDEFDVDETELIRETTSSEDELMVDGLTPLHELEDRFSLDLSNDEVSTVSGLITMELGRIPEAGEAVEAGGLWLEAVEVDDTRVLEARVRRLKEEADLEDAADWPDEGSEEENRPG